MLLRICYAVRSTERAYVATVLLRGVRYCDSVWCYGSAMRCAVLSSGMVLPGGGQRGLGVQLQAPRCMPLPYAPMHLA
eukprot:28170-Rhodomonas_salina.1